MTQLSYNHTLKACYVAGVVQSITCSFAPLLFVTFQKQYAIPLENITALITLNFLVQLVVDLFAARFIDRIGYRAGVIASQVFSAAGLAGLAILPEVMPTPYIGLLLAVGLYGIGGGLGEVLVSPIVEACPTQKKAAAMSLLHSFFCWGVAGVVGLSTLFFGLAGTENWPWLALLWALIPIANAVYFTRVPVYALTEKGEGMSIRELVSSRMFWVLAVLMICAGASEISMSQWASVFAEEGLQVSKAVGDLAGPCLFALMMGCARLLHSRFSERMALMPLLSGCGVLCVLSYALAAFSPWPGLSLAGCALCGLSVGIMWPGVYSMASAMCPRGGTALFALLALTGDAGCSIGPTLVGLVSGAAGDNLKAGLTAGLIFPLLLIAGIAVCRRWKTRGSLPE